MPYLNRDHGRPVLRAGPQLRSCAFSVVCTSRMSERMSEDMSERMSEDCFSQSAKLRVKERISGDELYVYPHLT